MAEDYYSTLGLRKGASSDEIQKAYRDQARKYHPDLNPDDDSARAKFQAIQNAYEVLNDPKKRELYDRYGSDFEQAGGGPAGAGPAGGWRTRSRSATPFDEVDLSQFFGEQMEGQAGGGFSDLFRQFTGRSSERRKAPKRGADITHQLEVPFRSAVSGGEAQISVRRQSGRVETIKVKIPAGIESGKKIRLRGQGEAAPPGGKAGDILITVKVAPHPFYQRQGNDLIVRVPVRLAEAIFGAKVDVPTPRGTITLTVPPGTSSGKRLRVRGHGVATAETVGDLYAELQIVLPESIDGLDSETKRALSQLDHGYGDDPRRPLIW